MAPSLDPADRDRIERLRASVGSPVAGSAPPHVHVVTPDAIRLFAQAYGDANPLYSDPGYAAGSARGEVTAPPLFPIATGEPAAVADDSVPVDITAVLGVDAPAAPASDRWTLHRPLGVGTRLTRASCLDQVSVEEDHATASWVVVARERTTYVADGLRYATHDRVRRYHPRPAGAASHPPRALASYTDRERDEIDRLYDAEEVRGPRPRRARDVAIGDALGPMVKGPLTVSDLVTYRGGVGPGPIGSGALGLGHRSRARRPGHWSLNRDGAFETIERRHWDVEYARSLGHPSAYDYSHTRLTWLSHLVTNWMGDAAWLGRIGGAMLAPNYVGDTHRIAGRVRDVDDRAGAGVVAVDLEARNQAGDLTYRGDAVVLLPGADAAAVTAEAIAEWADATDDR